MNKAASSDGVSRSIPPPQIVGEPYSYLKVWKRDGKERKTFYLDIITHDGIPRRLHASSLGILRAKLRYFKTLDRDLIDRLIPPGPAQTPPSPKKVRREQKRKRAEKSKVHEKYIRRDVTPETAPPCLSLADVMRINRARKGAR